MKNSILLTLAFCCWAIVAKAQMNFHQGTWQEVLAEAKKTKKPIFVDFYAEWCGPCKYMSKTVFADAATGDYFNKNFVSYKIDAEKQELDLVKQTRIEAYPSLYFFDMNGSVIYKNVGALDAAKFKQAGETALSNLQASADLPKMKTIYEKNPKDKKAASEYLNILVALSRYAEAKPIAEVYLAQVPDNELTTPEIWALIKNFAKNPDSREFKYVMQNSKVFLETYGEEFSEYVVGIVNEKLTEAVRSRNLNTLELTKKVYLAFAKATSGDKVRDDAYYQSILEMAYYEGIQDRATYFRIMSMWVDSFNMDNPQELLNRILETSDKYQGKPELQKAEVWATKLLSIDNNALSNFANAVVKEKLGDKTNAKKFAEAALSQSQDGDEIKTYIEELLAKLK